MNERYYHNLNSIMLSCVSQLVNIDTRNKCGVCRETYDNGTYLDCGHQYCDTCAKMMVKRKMTTCPCCRSKFKIGADKEGWIKVWNRKRKFNGVLPIKKNRKIKKFEPFRYRPVKQ